jgi:hypothetical protein
MRRLAHDTLIRRHMKVASRVRQERQKPNLAGFWVCVGDFVDVDDPGNDPPCTSPSSPAYEDSCTYAGPPYAYPAFRHGLDGNLEWRGHVDVSGASSPATLCTLPAEWRPDNDVSWPTDLWDGSAFTIGRVSIVASTGVVTLTWPAS